MRFEFTELDYEGDYKFGGRLALTATTQPEVAALIDHFKLFSDNSDVDVLRQRIDALSSDTLTHTLGTDKRPMYAVSGHLDHAFTAPYTKWAEDNLGYTGPLPELEIPRKWGGIIHTNYQARLHIADGFICFDAFVCAEPWDKKDASTYAEYLVKDYIGEEMGTRRREPEYIVDGRGQYKKNPDYLKRHRPTPSASNARLKLAIFDWWKQHHANAAQLAVIEGNRKVAEGADYMDAFRFERGEVTIHYSKSAKGYKSMSPSEFAKLT